MRRTQDNLTLLTCLFVMALLIANVVAARLVTTGVTVLGSEILVPGAVFCYTITFLLTDVICELWGKREAWKVVRYGMACQALAAGLIILTGWLPTYAPIRDAYDMILGQNTIFVWSSLGAYWISQQVDIQVFSWIKIKTRSRHKWLRNNGSTMTSQFIDTAVFITLAFGVGYGWLFDSAMWLTLLMMLVSQYLLKAALTILETPLFYLLTQNSHR